MDTKRTYSIWRYLVIFLTLVLPFLLIFATPFSEWKMRAIATAGFVIVFPIASLVYALHPKTKIVEDNILAEQAQARKRRALELFLRTGTFLFGLAMLWLMAWPYCQGMAALAMGQSPMRIQGEVCERSDLWGTYFLHQSFGMCRNTKEDYSLYYFPRYRVGRGDSVDMLVLPHTDIVLTVERKNMSSGSTQD